MQSQRISFVPLPFAALVWAALPAAAAADSQVDDGRTLSPYFFVDGDPSVDNLPLESTSVETDVAGVIASVTVKQTYKNDGKRPINARYVFPASTRAAVHGMRMTVGGEIIEAKIAERQKARETFEKARQEGKNASLLEQDRPNVFSMEVANVQPGDRIEVELRYTELLVPTDGTYEFVYPAVVGPRYPSPKEKSDEHDRHVESGYQHAGVAPAYAFDVKAHVAAGLPIQRVEVPSHQAAIENKGAEARIALDASERGKGNKDFILRYRLAGEQIASGLMLYQGAKENFFLLMVEPPRRVKQDEIPAREYVFIIDVSGSMVGFPLVTTKKLLRDLVGGLRPTDTFNVMLFSGGQRVLSPRSLPADEANVEKALAIIDGEQGGGATELLPAMEAALAMPHDRDTARTFVVVTDGYISAEREVFEHIRKNLGKANVFAFGIGSSVNRFLIEGVARAGMGEPFVVTGSDEAPKAAERFREYIKTPVLTGIAVNYQGFVTYDVEPVAVPDLLAQRPLIVHGKWRGAAGGRITVTGKTGAGKYLQVIEVSGVKPDAANAPLAYLWARTRIAALSDFSFGEETEVEKAEITRLGLKYNLLTQYTSFVAVREKVRNAEAGKDVEQPLPMPEGVTDLAVGDASMTSGSEPELFLLLGCAGALMVGFALQRRRQSGAGVARP